MQVNMEESEHGPCAGYKRCEEIFEQTLRAKQNKENRKREGEREREREREREKERERS